jgi:MSHA biogenesis protein MshP
VALVGAIFVVVVLGMLGIYMVTLSGVQLATTSQAAVAARVYYGAKAGLEWGIHQAIGPTVPVCNASTPLAPISGLDGIRVTVTCTPTAASVYYLISTAEFGTYGTADYAKREVEATVTNLP